VLEALEEKIQKIDSRRWNGPDGGSNLQTNSAQEAQYQMEIELVLSGDISMIHERREPPQNFNKKIHSSSTSLEFQFYRARYTYIETRKSATPLSDPTHPLQKCTTIRYK
jgi:hypothetical protein